MRYIILLSDPGRASVVDAAVGQGKENIAGPGISFLRD